MRPARIKKRRDFLAAARARKFAAPGLVLQYRDRRDAEPPRIGFTASKKVGGAVVRNRAKRRMRAIADEAGEALRPGGDYVLIARADATVGRAFDVLRQDFFRALKAVHAPRKKEQASHDSASPPRPDRAP